MTQNVQYSPEKQERSAIYIEEINTNVIHAMSEYRVVECVSTPATLLSSTLLNEGSVLMLYITRLCHDQECR